MAAYEKPVPRPSKSPAKLAQLQRQNRRREYFRRTPSYLSAPDHELADPVLYGRLVKHFQTPAERQAEGRAKGYGRTLEADLVRGETKLELAAARTASSSPSPGSDAAVYAWEGPAESKVHGLQLWHAFLQERFVRGEDDDFDYAGVDGDEELDAVEREEAEEAWFEQEDPAWASEELLTGEKKKDISGQTGVQDF